MPKGQHNNHARGPAIRRAYAKGGITQVELAAEYGVSQLLISNVVRNKIWKEADQ